MARILVSALALLSSELQAAGVQSRFAQIKSLIAIDNETEQAKKRRL